MKVVAAWSGGKDSAFALYKAVQQGHRILNILTFMHSETTSNFHGIKSELLDAQAQAVGIPLVKRITTPETYEQEFKDALQELKCSGAEGLVTGDIYEVAMHEERWLERVCAEIGLEPIRPLWRGDTAEIFGDFVSAGFRATVIRARLDVLSVDWLGRQLDQAFLSDILKLGKVDPCGEGGEYHTFVTDGPNFKSGIKLLKTRKMVLDGYGHLEVGDFKVLPKKVKGSLV
jgi:diphthine-ammonia ligase